MLGIIRTVSKHSCFLMVAITWGIGASNSIQAQTIRAVIYAESSVKVRNAAVLFKDVNDTTWVGEFVLARDGEFTYKLERKYDNLLIEVSAIGFSTTRQLIEHPQREEEYNLTFYLKPSEYIALDQVVVSAANRPYQIKRDTVVYKASEYIQPEDRKVEDLLKKLPGIEVDDSTGEIKYRGKSIEALLLEGDNLFKRNYVLGSRNINVKLIEEVEAIENYQENPLLRGISSQDKVALNLKLIPGNIDLSGSFDLGSGLFETDSLASSLNAHILSISQRLKSFSIVSSNNIGQNNSPYVSGTGELKISDIEESDRMAFRLIELSRSTNILDPVRSTINNNFFVNHKNLIKFSPVTKLTSDIFYYRDRLYSDQFVRNDIDVGDDSFITLDENRLRIEPRYFRFDLDFEHRLSENTLLEYESSFRREEVLTRSLTSQNQNSIFNIGLTEVDSYMSSDFLFTKRFSSHSVVQFSSKYSENRIPQRFEIEPLSLSPDSTFIQTSEFRNKYLELQTTLLGVIGKSKFNVQLDYQNVNVPFFSERNEEDEENDIENINNSQYESNLLSAELNWAVTLNAFRINSTIKLTRLDQRLNNFLHEEEQSRNSYWESKFAIIYRPSRVSRISAIATTSLAPLAQQYLFRNQVQVSNRTSIRSFPGLQLQRNNLVSINYSLNDLFNQMDVGSNLYYRTSSGNFITDTQLNENTTLLEYFFAPQKITSFGGFGSISKFISLLQCTVKGTVGFNAGTFQNIVNESGIRTNRNLSFNSTLFVKTSFDLPINIENGLDYSRVETRGGDQNKFVNSSLNNKTKVNLDVSERINVGFTSNYFLPDVREYAQDFLFLDTSVEYSPSKRRDVRFGIEMRNVLNEKNFLNIQTTDISTTVFGTNLLPFHFLVSLSINF